MNLLVVAPLAPQAQATNAVPLVVNTLLDALAPRHRITLLTATEYGQSGEELALWRERGVRVRCVPRRLPAGAKRWTRRARLASGWFGGIPWRTVWYWEPRLQTALHELAAREAFDLIAVQDNAAGLYDFGNRVPKLLTEMEVRTPDAPRPVHRPGGLRDFLVARDRRRWQSYQRAVWRRFDAIQVLTSRDARAIQALAPELGARTCVNPFGVDLPREVFPERAHKGNILFVGGFTHGPNVDAALWLATGIFPRIAACEPGASLTLVGSYPPESVRALARGNITVAANVPAVEPYLERAAVVVAPMRRGGGQRLKVLQGMAHGKAVVATPLGAEGLDLWGAPPVRIAEDASSFADAVVDLLRSAHARDMLGAEARQFVERHFSPEAYARRLETMYAHIMGSAK